MEKQIEKILEDEPNFRKKQVIKNVFSKLITDWKEASDLPEPLRKKLTTFFPLNLGMEPEKVIDSADGLTTKVLFRLHDGLKIESVLMKHADRRMTVCVSSQAGCAIKCKFCATGKQGFNRNLTSMEITGQALYFSKILKNSGEKVTNVVFMGMGEPFLNYTNVIFAIKLLNNEDAFNIGARKISVSTSGIPEGIKKFSEEGFQANLAISLHAPNNPLRSELMPINTLYPIEKVLSAVDDYIKKTKRKVMFEYLMLDGINDGIEQAKELALLLKKPLYMVNLITYNPTGCSNFKPSKGQRIKKFREILEKAGVPVAQRYRFGRNIKAGCGQLSGEL